MPRIQVPVLVLALALAAGGAAAQSNPLVNPTNGHTYFLSDQPLMHCVARNFAAESGGYLVAVNDAAEHAWLQSNFSGNGSVWLGCSDEVTEGTWLWDSGEPFTYSAWCPGEPNNFYLENWAEMNDFCGPAGLGWNDVWPLNLMRALVEVPNPALPYSPPAGPGQANSAGATLLLDFEGCSGVGPFTANYNGGSTITFRWSGPAYQPYILFAGPPNPTSAFAGCAGWVDIGTPPFFGDVIPVFPAILQPFFILDDNGYATQGFSTSPSTGPFSITVQGVVIQPPASTCPVKLTAAFTINVF